MISLPSRLQLIAAALIAGVLAIPGVVLVSLLVVFPILFYGALAIFVNAGLVALVVAYGLHRFGLYSTNPTLWHKWILSTIVWTGCAVGLANNGIAAGAIGGKNVPVPEVFFAPVLLLFGYPVG